MLRLYIYPNEYYGNYTITPNGLNAQKLFVRNCFLKLKKELKIFGIMEELVRGDRKHFEFLISKKKFLKMFVSIKSFVLQVQ